MQETLETQVQSLDQEDPLEKEIATHSSIFFIGRSMDKGAWWAAIHGCPTLLFPSNCHFHFPRVLSYHVWLTATQMPCDGHLKTGLSDIR